LILYYKNYLQNAAISARVKVCTFALVQSKMWKLVPSLHPFWCQTLMPAKRCNGGDCNLDYLSISFYCCHR